MIKYTLQKNSYYKANQMLSSSQNEIHEHLKFKTKSIYIIYVYINIQSSTLTLP